MRICGRLIELWTTVLQLNIEEDLHRLKNEQRRKKRKRIWIKKWIQHRSELGFSNTLMKELAEEELEDFKNIIRQSKEQFNELLEIIGPKIQRNNITIIGYITQ